ncbi:MAG: ABC transporter substrate-binding protein [Deltaproteobacteria bacterium]|nr:ABC transporter substrate-binding protein [Deltaproteobacteria bacterium]
MTSKSWFLLWAALWVLLLSLRGEAQELRKVYIAVPGISPGASSVFVIAKEMGYYRDEGLQVELVVMPAAVSVQALIGGNVEFVSAGGAVIPPALRGASIRFLFSAFYRPMYWLFSRPELRTIKSLKGRKVGVSSIGSGPDSLLRQILRANGIDGGRDVTIMAVGASTARFFALQAGSVDAAMLGIPANLMAQDAGFHGLVSFIQQEFVEFQGNVVVREGLQRSDPALIEKFLRGTVKGFIYYGDNRLGASKILGRFMKVSEDRMARTYDAILPGLTQDGTVSEELQKKSVEHILERVGLKEPPPMDKIFNYTLTKKIYEDLRSKGWRAGP